MSEADIQNSTDLTGKTAMITGASSGLGVRFAKVLAAAGARVVIAARRADKLAELADVITKNGGTAHAVSLDVNDFDAIPDFFATLRDDGFMPDILINNAGMNVVKTALDYSVADYNQVMGTNLTGPFFLSTEMARHHIAQGSAARIVNIASVGGFKVLPGLTPYCTSKSGILMMTKGLAREWARTDINVNAICPGYIETEINDFWWKTEGGKKQMAGWPRRRLANQSDLDGALLLLAGPMGAGMTGTSITVDDGQYI
ncbi:MAG: SDR family NAD(P)-dependent oxidoreductase [Rhodobiaceae bacterium]|mgnify:FL=1|jgi:NAD(P)-dependent dehydrogenase (short-subunit alcohol dehydrogenase family)|nr:SDR family NAD(P)-dependent oxidoreductase [Rhodobiaceae bacterium]